MLCFLLFQDYAEFEPTYKLPNGLPHGVTYPLVKVSALNPVHPEFDVWGYVDIIKLKWLGVSFMFGAIDEKVFPEGLSISQVFDRNEAREPRIIAHLFGGNGNAGTVSDNGGVALFANVYELICMLEDRPTFCENSGIAPIYKKKKIEFKPEDQYYSGGNLSKPIKPNDWEKMKMGH